MPGAFQLCQNLSPDGRFLSFDSDESGRSEVYVMPYPGPGERRRVSSDGAQVARWSRDGRELIFVSGDRHSWSGFVVTPDGKRFLAIVPEAIAGGQPLTVVANWVPGAGR